MKLTNNIMGEYQALSEKNVKQTTSAIYSVHVVRFPYPFIYLIFEKVPLLGGASLYRPMYGVPPPPSSRMQSKIAFQ